MIPSGKNTLLLLFFLLLWNPGHSQDLFNPENSKKFANYLFSTQQYNLAANEYERILTVFYPDAYSFSRLMASYRYGIICTHSFRNLTMLGIERFFPKDAIAEEYLKLALTCNCCYESADFNQALTFLTAERQLFYRFGHYLFNEPDSLLSFAGKHRDLLTDKYPAMITHVGMLSDFQRKSPGLAMAMSALLPGSGKAYSGYWGDAVMSLIFVTSNAWLSYRGFKKRGEQSAGGWIFGGVSLGFYFGNIWGSGRAAKTYNQMEYEKLYHDAKNSYYSHF